MISWPWPKDVRANIAHRRKLLDAADADEDLRAAIIYRCAQDPIWFIDGFGWTFDPRKSKHRVIPWVTWPYQEQAIRDLWAAVEKGEDRLIDKSRDMGATWCILGLFFWYWRFTPQLPLTVVSCKEEKVDKKGNPDSLFWKLDFLHEHLPKWMQVDVYRTHMHMGNQFNKSVIDGEATTENVTRSGRRKAGFFDEWAVIEQAEAIEAGTADTMPCRIFASTPNGAWTMHTKMRFSNKVKVIVFHWSQHPAKRAGLYTTKNGLPVIMDTAYKFPHDYKFNTTKENKLRSPWYDAEEARRVSRRAMAQEVDIEHLAAGSCFFDTATLSRILSENGTVKPPLGEGDVSFKVVTRTEEGNEYRRVQDVELVRGGNPRPLRWWCEFVGDEPSKKANYAIGADIGEGKGLSSSNSVLSVVDVATGHKVAEWVSCVKSPKEFAQIACAVGVFFGGQRGYAFLIHEQNGPGLAFGEEVRELGYPYIYWQRKEQSAWPKDKDVPGWQSGKTPKRILLSNYDWALTNGTFTNPSAEALTECFGYVFLNDGNIGVAVTPDADPAGTKSSHGDRVIADALAYKGMEEQPQAKEEEKPQASMSLAVRREMRKEAEIAAEIWN